MRLIAQPPDFRRKSVAEVWNGSPAAEAGIRPSDEIRAMNGVPVATLSLVDVMRLLRKNKTSRLTTVRAGASSEVILHARKTI